MASYVMDVMCASREYLALGWKWDPSRPSIHCYCKVLWDLQSLVCSNLLDSFWRISSMHIPRRTGTCVEIWKLVYDSEGSLIEDYR